MTKRIFVIFSVSAVILVISIGLILGLLYGHFGKRLEKELKQEAAYLALAVEKDGEESLAKLSKTGERVTLIDSDGTVLYDNKTDPAAMENHQDRSEVQEAEKSGEGYASRTSATLGKKDDLLCSPAGKRADSSCIQYAIYGCRNPGRNDPANPGNDLPYADPVSGSSLPLIQKDRRAVEQSESG